MRDPRGGDQKLAQRLRCADDVIERDGLNVLAQARYAWMNLNHVIAMQVGGAGGQAFAGDDMRFRAVDGINEGELQGRFRVAMRSDVGHRYDQSAQRGDQTSGSAQTQRR